MLRRAGPLWTCRCRRENGLAVLPLGKSRGRFFFALGAFVLRFAPESARHLVQHGAFVTRETLEPGRRYLVEHAIELSCAYLPIGAHRSHHPARAGALRRLGYGPTRAWW